MWVEWVKKPAWAGTCHVKSPAMDTIKTIFQIPIHLSSLSILPARVRGRLAAKNLFFWKQLAMHQGRSIKPGRILPPPGEFGK